ncbi:MAG: polymer-forming cytoskeletal protein [Lachnospiraceae bacterium]|nr:polymer-forming cytoskeletal protein [Lachnospiraceae bacterium]
MSFLKEFKDDLAQAVNELVAEDPTEVTTKKSGKNSKEKSKVKEQDEEEMVNTLDEDMDALDLDKLNSVLDAVDEELANEEMKLDGDEAEISDLVNEEAEAKADSEIIEENTLALDISRLMEEEDLLPEEEKVKENKNQDILEAMEEETVDTITNDIASDEVTDITKGTTITGNISSTGSVNVYGTITGDISCKGKLTVTGTIKGTSEAKEIFANNAKIEGDIKSDGTIKVGNGSIIIGNVIATSAVIGGAIKGDIDVHGPVIVDSTAVVKGNIKSRSVQINNGAAIEGFCSQCYADIDYKSLFDETFGDK